MHHFKDKNEPRNLQMAKKSSAFCFNFAKTSCFQYFFQRRNNCGVTDFEVVNVTSTITAIFSRTAMSRATSFNESV
jgi:hypothetical protein